MDSPPFEFVEDGGRLTVISLPERFPVISGNKGHIYELGDAVSLNCTCHDTYPAATIRWFINGKEVRRKPLLSNKSHFGVVVATTISVGRSDGRTDGRTRLGLLGNCQDLFAATSEWPKLIWPLVGLCISKDPISFLSSFLKCSNCANEVVLVAKWRENWNLHVTVRPYANVVLLPSCHNDRE